jgi:hypothetical protein
MFAYPPITLPLMSIFPLDGRADDIPVSSAPLPVKNCAATFPDVLYDTSLVVVLYIKNAGDAIEFPRIGLIVNVPTPGLVTGVNEVPPPALITMEFAKSDCAYIPMTIILLPVPPELRPIAMD